MNSDRNHSGHSKSNLLIVAFAFSAFYCYSFILLLNIIPEAAPGFVGTSILQASFTLIIAIGLIFASFKINKMNSFKTIISSLIMAIIVTSFIPLTPWLAVRMTLIFFAGILYSVGQLSVLTYFWNNSQSQKRGWLGGQIALLTTFLYLVTRAIGVQSSLLTNSVIVACAPIILALLITVIYAKSHPQNYIAYQKNYYPEKRTVFLYFIPWILFCFINGTIAKNIDLPSTQILSSQYILLLVIQTGSSIIGALAGGIIADFFGRRLSLALSVTLYGLSMALSGIQNVPILFLAFTFEGFGWGILLTLYNFVIWGDLANEKNCTKMYAMGLAVYCTGLGIGQLPTVLSQISPTNSALIGCSVIFLSNLPIALAPELLPSEGRKKRRLKGYIRKVKEIADNYD
jgi:hypothetical protein